ncbi:MAG: septum formation inhibitor Maf [Balneola sp.]|nr:septum formation inhibitor Maf [Balneola sp.]MBO6651758.1 septum formation inhibitor Maf [Balneola sp.]MBO6711105.1 septum formation inhibitor Maf [Balneola sp.]MBO6800781.1 septum formation inhibitor Maf [Balneola sp.]MBO6869040.1 septum formation inhibitor Maf [Balneola sp.]
MKIILASQSPRRKKLLEQLGLQFEVIPSSVNENNDEPDPVKLVESLAFQKANDVSKSNPESLIIGSDTVVVYKNKILGKPENKNEASIMLNELSGKQHFVYTGVALIKTDHQSSIANSLNFSETTIVHFSKLDQSEIDSYINTGSPMDKAGSYGIQDDWGAVFVKQIEGDFYNVVGLPINRLYFELKKFFPEVINSISLNN